MQWRFCEEGLHLRLSEWCFQLRFSETGLQLKRIETGLQFRLIEGGSQLRLSEGGLQMIYWNNSLIVKFKKLIQTGIKYLKILVIIKNVYIQSIVSSWLNVIIG